MKDLCHDVFGISKEKKDPKNVKSNRGTSQITALDFQSLCVIVYVVISVHAIFQLLNLMCLHHIADLLDALPEKRRAEDGGYSSGEGKEVRMVSHSFLVLYMLRTAVLCSYWNYTFEGLKMCWKNHTPTQTADLSHFY